MKKLLVAGAASLSLAALPVISSFAAPLPIIDNLTVNIGESCTFIRGTAGGSGTYAQDMTPNQLSSSFGSSEMTIECNYASGYKITAAFEDLTGPGTAISYDSTTAPVAGSGTWAATISSKTVDGTTTTPNTLVANGGIVLNNTNPTTSADKVTVVYSVSTGAGQAQGQYTGRATYTVSDNNS